MSAHASPRHADMAETFRRSIQVNRAFFRMGWLNVTSYPLAFATTQISVLWPIAMYAFVARLVEDTPAVGGDYYTYVIIGLVSLKLLDGSLSGFGTMLDYEIQAGRLEALLVEPIRWRLLPFGIVQFQFLMRVITTGMIVLVALTFGATFRFAGLPMALLVLMLGSASTLAVGILGASVKLLSKRSDPLLTFYTLAASLLSGVYFPVEHLPGFLRPLAYAIPHTYVNIALRKLLMPQGDTLPGMTVSNAVLSLVVLCIILYPISLWIYGRSLEYGRRLGLLAGY